MRKEDTYKKEIIVLTEKNFELNLELEKTHREIPRLKAFIFQIFMFVYLLNGSATSTNLPTQEKIDEQQRYIDVLRSEQQHMVAMNKSRDSLSSISATSASVRKVGELG